MSDLAILALIQMADPDGGTREPTDRDRAAFKAWVIRKYGGHMWARYAAGGWEPFYGV
jgi:hypothetical protein